MVIDHLRGVEAARVYLGGLTEMPYASELTRAEVIAGLRSAERRSAEQLFALIEWVAVGERLARQAGVLGRTYRHSHAGIGVADLVVAATAQELRADLATHNVKHYPMFKGLRPPY